jgi:prophage antirepressor-like protein
MRRNMPDAECFQDGVVREILPQIRRICSDNAPVQNILDAPKSRLLKSAYEQPVQTES